MNEWTERFVSSGAIIGLTALGLVVIHFLGQQILRTLTSQKHLREARRKQLITIVRVLRWALRIGIIVSALLMLLSTFNIDIAPLLASVGVAGLALGLGAQTLIKDLIGGLLILVENQYVVGDFIQMGDISGEVERVTLRATYVRDWAGRLHIIPNGEVRILANHTKEWSRALLEIGVAYEEDLEHVLSVSRRIAEEFAQDPEWGPQLLETPQADGPMTLGDWAVTIRVMVKTQPGKQWAVARQLRKRILATFEQEGICMPYPRQVVWARQEGWSKAESPAE